MAVVVFFGVVPVTFTCYLQMQDWSALPLSLPTAVATGLVAANVLIVNNYRDADDDEKVNKRTTVVIFGRKVMHLAYLALGIAAVAVTIPVWLCFPPYFLAAPICCTALHIKLWHKLKTSRGSAINPLLGKTALNLLLFSLLLTTAFIMFR